MRILHVVHRFADESAGGTELHVRDLAARQASAEGGAHVVGVFARVLRPEANDFAPVDDGAKDGVRRFGFNHIGRRGISFFERDDLPAAVAAFEAAVAAFAPDVVHVHHLGGLSAGILRAAKRRGTRVVLTVHDHALACPRGRRIRLDLEACPVLDRERCARCVRPAWIEAVRAPNRLRALLGLLRPGASRRLFARRDAFVRDALDACDVIVAPSASAAELFREFFDPGIRLAVVPHGSPPPAEIAPPSFPADRPMIVGVFGCATLSKGAHVAAAALARLSSDAARLQIHGPAADAVRRRIESEGGGLVSFEGEYRPEDLTRKMSGVDVVAVPSLWPETFSLALREAWAHRRPVVVSSTGALIDAVGADDRRGLAASPGVVDAWSKAFRRLRSDAALFARLTGPFADPPRAAALDALTLLYRSAPAAGPSPC